MFYLAGAVISGLAHMATSEAPCIGASGAVAACCGAFLAFFPRGHVRVLAIFIMMGVFQIRSVWFIGLYIAIDIVKQLGEWTSGFHEQVAYSAHLGGYAFGFGVGVALLGFKILPRDDYDAFFLFKQFRRRAALRALNRTQPTSVWASSAADTSDRLAKQARRAPAFENPKAVELRRQIAILLGQHNLAGAAKVYRELRQADPKAVLAETRQLDIANQFASEGEWASAVDAYEAFLAAFPTSGHRDEVMLLLAMVWVRKAPNPERARAMLDDVRPRLHDGQQRALAEQLATEIPG